MDQHRIASPEFAAVIAATGAELVSLRGADGAELIWQAGAAWPRHAPLLFPIVGRLKGDTLRHDGQDHRLTQHGFARDMPFRWVERGETSCRLVLTDDAQTRQAYPFAFRLEAAYAVIGDTLSVTLTVTNTGPSALPCSLGAHPGFVWPLRAGVPKQAHTIRFERFEPAPIRRLEGGLMLPDPYPSPVEAGVLALDEQLFAADALVFDQLASTSLRYTCPGGPSLTLAWTNCPQLGIWGRAGADFVCIEPWHGFASPSTFAGPFADKPGLLRLSPGESGGIGFTIQLSSRHD